MKKKIFIAAAVLISSQLYAQSDSTNVLGTNQDVYVRGAAAGKTLILLDGIPVYDASGISGAFDLNFINIDQVERVEIFCTVLLCIQLTAD